MGRRTTSQRDRAVTDTVAYVLMFSIIVTGVGLVATSGVDSLAELRQDEQLNAADRSMQTLDATFDDLDGGSAPRRRIALPLKGGSVYLANSTVNVTVTTGSGPRTTRVDVGSFRHRLDDEEVVSEGGAVFRSVVVRRPPSIRCTGTTAVVHLRKYTTASGVPFYYGSGDEATVRVVDDGRPFVEPGRPNETRPSSANLELVANHSETTVDATLGSATGVVVNVSGTATPEGWRAYFERNPRWSRTGDDAFSCSSSRVYLRVTTVELRTTLLGP